MPAIDERKIMEPDVLWWIMVRAIVEEISCGKMEW